MRNQPPIIWIATRHPGALEFLHGRGLSGRHCKHLSAADVNSGDTVIGNLPMPLVAQLCAKNVHYWHLCVEVESHERGQELTAEQLEARGVTVRQFQVEELRQ
jgi:CRISPR-associated protein Csx16